MQTSLGGNHHHARRACSTCAAPLNSPSRAASRSSVARDETDAGKKLASHVDLLRTERPPTDRGAAFGPFLPSPLLSPLSGKTLCVPHFACEASTITQILRLSQRWTDKSRVLSTTVARLSCTSALLSLYSGDQTEPSEDTRIGVALGPGRCVGCC